MTLTYMRREIHVDPEATVRMLCEPAHDIKVAGVALAAKNPPFIARIARGTSDHAASFLKYAIWLTAGRPVASPGPSLASLDGAKLNLASCGVISFFQSGKSPDFVATGYPLTDASIRTIPVYGFAAASSRHMGLGPDKPANLNKVTETR